MLRSDEASSALLDLRMAAAMTCQRMGGAIVCGRSSWRSAPIGEKVAHVRRAGQSRNHTCHWPGCDRQVPPAMWGCKPHWFALPADLRSRVWAAYRPGQEEDGRPSAAYLQVAREVQAWVREHAVSPTAPRQGALPL